MTWRAFTVWLLGYATLTLLAGGFAALRSDHDHILDARQAADHSFRLRLSQDATERALHARITADYAWRRDSLKAAVAGRRDSLRLGLVAYRGRRR